MSRKRHTVHINETGTWTVHHAPWSRQAAEEAYSNKAKEIKKNKKGGVRLTAPSGDVLKEYIFTEGEEGTTVRTTEQMSLF